MLQVQKELIWKPEEFSEDTDGNCPLKGWTQIALSFRSPRSGSWVQTQTTAQPHPWNSTSASPKNQALGSTRLAAQVPQPCGTTLGTSAELPIS